MQFTSMQRTKFQLLSVLNLSFPECAYNVLFYISQQSAHFCQELLRCLESSESSQFSVQDVEMLVPERAIAWQEKSAQNKSKGMGNDAVRPTVAQPEPSDFRSVVIFEAVSV